MKLNFEHVNLTRFEDSAICQIYYVMDVEGRKGGLAMLWSSEWDVNMKSYSSNHIDTLIKLKDG